MATRGASDHDGWEAGLVDLSRDRTLANLKQGRGASYRDRVPRDRVSTALTDLRARLDQFRMAADADLAALLQQELRGALDRYEEMKAKSGALDFLDLLLVARNLVRDNRHVREGFQQRFRRIFVDEFQDTDPLQAEILLLLAADDPSETDWRKAQAARRDASSWSAIRSSRSTGSAARTSPSIAKCASASRTGAPRSST